MSILDKIVAAVSRIARAIVPTRAVDAIRDATARRRHARSMVTRDPGFVIWFRRAILRRKPVLFHFEVQLTDHCNLDCKGCEHFSTLCPPTFADLREFDSDMEHMSHLFSRVRDIGLLGGEPLLHPQVLEFYKSARSRFPKSRIYLQTNGTLVMAQNEQFWNALAESRIALLCDSFTAGVPVVEINAMGKRHKVRVEWTDPREEFCKVPIDLAGGQDASSSFARCRGYKNRPILRNGQLYPCAYVAYADVFREHFGIAGLQVYPTDSIGIRYEPDSEQVMSFLRNPVHWCTNCDMDNRSFHDREHTQRDISEWTSAAPPARPAGH